MSDLDPIDALGLNTRIINILKNSDVWKDGTHLQRGIHTIAELIDCRAEEIGDVRGIGPSGLSYISAALARHGLAFKQPD